MYLGTLPEVIHEAIGKLDGYGRIPQNKKELAENIRFSKKMGKKYYNKGGAWKLMYDKDGSLDSFYSGLGTASGTAAGAMVGSVIPGVGTAMGAGIGALAGYGYGNLVNKGMHYMNDWAENYPRKRKR